MIIKFFAKHGRSRPGGGRRAVRYLVNEIDPVNKQQRLVAPEVISGDPEQTARLIDSLSFVYSYKSGVLSWAPGETVTPEQERDAIQRFEKAAFAGLEADQYSILWVRHQHAGHHELHFVTPRVELSTGKSLNIDPPGKIKRELYDCVRKHYNLEHGFSDPEDPAHRRALKLPDHVYYQQAQNLKQGIASEKDPREVVHQHLSRQIEAGAIRDRAGIISELEACGLEITRQGENYLSIKNPETGKNIRLKGACYEQNWNFGRDISQERGREEQGIVADHKRELERLQIRIDELTRSREQYHQSRYPQRVHSLQRELNVTETLHLQEPSLSISSDHGRISDSDIRPPVLSRSLDREPDEANQIQRHDIAGPSEGPRERLIFEPPGRPREEIREDQTGDGMDVDDGQHLGGNGLSLKEAYDTTGKAAIECCEEIGERIEREREAFNDVLEGHRDTLNTYDDCIDEAHRSLQQGDLAFESIEKVAHRHKRRIGLPPM